MHVMCAHFKSKPQWNLYHWQISEQQCKFVSHFVSCSDAMLTDGCCYGMTCNQLLSDWLLSWLRCASITAIGTCREHCKFQTTHLCKGLFVKASSMASQANSHIHSASLRPQMTKKSRAKVQRCLIIRTCSSSASLMLKSYSVNLTYICNQVKVQQFRRKDFVLG